MRCYMCQQNNKKYLKKNVLMINIFVSKNNDRHRAVLWSIMHAYEWFAIPAPVDIVIVM